MADSRQPTRFHRIVVPDYWIFDGYIDSQPATLDLPAELLSKLENVYNADHNTNWAENPKNHKTITVLVWVPNEGKLAVRGRVIQANFIYPPDVFSEIRTLIRAAREAETERQRIEAEAERERIARQAAEVLAHANKFPPGTRCKVTWLGTLVHRNGGDIRMEEGDAVLVIEGQRQDTNGDGTHLRIPVVILTTGQQGYINPYRLAPCIEGEATLATLRSLPFGSQDGDEPGGLEDALAEVEPIDQPAPASDSDIKYSRTPPDSLGRPPDSVRLDLAQPPQHITPPPKRLGRKWSSWVTEGMVFLLAFGVVLAVAAFFAGLAYVLVDEAAAGATVLIGALLATLIADKVTDRWWKKTSGDTPGLDWLRGWRMLVVFAIAAVLFAVVASVFLGQSLLVTLAVGVVTFIVLAFLGHIDWEGQRRMVKKARTDANKGKKNLWWYAEALIAYTIPLAGVVVTLAAIFGPPLYLLLFAHFSLADVIITIVVIVVFIFALAMIVKGNKALRAAYFLIALYIVLIGVGEWIGITAIHRDYAPNAVLSVGEPAYNELLKPAPGKLWSGVKSIGWSIWDAGLGDFIYPDDDSDDSEAAEEQPPAVAPSDPQNGGQQGVQTDPPAPPTEDLGQEDEAAQIEPYVQPDPNAPPVAAPNFNAPPKAPPVFN